MTGLLVSVRSAVEAEIALAGGAALIDIKEPARGALGRADEATIAAVVGAVAHRRPVSAALGELVDGQAAPMVAGLHFVKWGLAGGARLDWRSQLNQRLLQTGPQTVVVAYADWQCAAAPPIEEVVSFACGRPGNVLLIDTHCKDAAPRSLRRRPPEKGTGPLNAKGPVPFSGGRPTLLDWLSADDVSAICHRCREAGVRVALAGSLGSAEIEMLLPAAPDWFAVRGTVCEENERGASIRLAKVRALAAQLSATAARSAG